MMKRIGLGWLVVGFVWLLIDAVSTFNSYQHTRWIWKSQNLPAGESISREAAVLGMRELSLDLKYRHRFILIPGCLMLAGGLLIFISSRSVRTTNTAEQDAS
jgi:hypothetical protein